MKVDQKSWNPLTKTPANHDALWTEAPASWRAGYRHVHFAVWSWTWECPWTQPSLQCAPEELLHMKILTRKKPPLHLTYFKNTAERKRKAAKEYVQSIFKTKNRPLWFRDTNKYDTSTEKEENSLFLNNIQYCGHVSCGKYSWISVWWSFFIFKVGG